MHPSTSTVPSPQVAAAVAAVVFLAIGVPLLGILMIPVVALGAAGRALGAAFGAAGAAGLVE